LNLKAYHDDPQVKEKYVTRMKNHIKADELIHGEGWDGKRGCAVGCTLDRYDHACYQNELGLPEWLARLEDTIFENMSKEKSKTFPLLLLEAIPVGVDLQKTFHKFQIFVLELAKKHVEKKYSSIIKIIDDVIDLHLKSANGMLIDDSAWSAARSAAESAARSAAESAARSAAESAAWSAAESAAWSAAESAAWSAAWSAAFDEMADKLIELLKEAEN
jgi:hypothetical protein